MRLQSGMVLVTIIMFSLSLWVNEMVFTRMEFAQGINWVYLPAGMRLLCIFLFAEAGLVGLLLVSWWSAFFYVFPDDPIRAFVGGIISAIAPYLTYLVARRAMGIKASLSNLTSVRLFYCMVGCAFASPLLHHLFFYFHGQTEHLFSGFVAMFTGDLVGSLIVIYAAKALLSLTPPVSANPS